MSIYKREDVYWFHFWFDGQHFQRSTKQGNPRVARQMEAAFRTKLAKEGVGIIERKPVPAFNVAIKQFLAWSEQQHRAHSRTYERYQVSSIPLLAYFKARRLDHITPEEVEAYKVGRAAEKGKRTHRTLRPATVNRELACLKALFNFAIKSDVVLRNPVSRVKFLAENNEQTRVLAFNEQQRYMAAATPILRDVATIIVETGVRPEEVYRLTPENVNLERGYIQIPCGKTKAARRKVRLTTAVREVLTRRLGSQGLYLFPCEADATRPMPKINNAHDRAVKLSKVAPFRLYDLRHTFATRAAMSGIDLVTLAAILGHSRIQMVLRYAHPTDDHQIQAIRKLEEYNEQVKLKHIQMEQLRAAAPAIGTVQ